MSRSDHGPGEPDFSVPLLFRMVTGAVAALAAGWLVSRHVVPRGPFVDTAVYGLLLILLFVTPRRLGGSGLRVGASAGAVTGMWFSAVLNVVRLLVEM